MEQKVDDKIERSICICVHFFHWQKSNYVNFYVNLYVKILLDYDRYVKNPEFLNYSLNIYTEEHSKHHKAFSIIGSSCQMPLTVAAIMKLFKFKTEGHSQHLSILNKIEWAKDVLANW